METILYQHVTSGDQYAVTYDYDGETVIDVAHYANGRAFEHQSDSDRLEMIAWFADVEYNEDDQVMFQYVMQLEYIP